MADSYKKLWRLFTDQDVKKKDLESQTKISHYTIAEQEQEYKRRYS